MRKYLLVLPLLCLFFSAGFALAQDDSKSNDDAKMPVIEKLLALENNDQSEGQMVEALTGELKEAMSSVPPSFWTKEQDVLKAELPKFHDAIAQVYAKNFSLDELQAIVRFYKTPAGKKFAVKLPTITMESQQAGLKWGQQIAAKVREDLKADGYGN